MCGQLASRKDGLIDYDQEKASATLTQNKFHVSYPTTCKMFCKKQNKKKTRLQPM